MSQKKKKKIPLEIVICIRIFITCDYNSDSFREESRKPKYNVGFSISMLLVYKLINSFDYKYNPFI